MWYKQLGKKNDLTVEVQRAKIFDVSESGSWLELITLNGAPRFASRDA
jgi:hypothetical protein